MSRNETKKQYKINQYVNKTSARGFLKQNELKVNGLGTKR